MKTPNDKKRPNTNSGAEETRRRKERKYVWVSKRILEVPVFAADGSLTNIKQTVAEKRGRTYVNLNPKKMSKKERRALDKLQGISA